MKTRRSKRAHGDGATFTLPTDHHGLLGAATLSGAVAGATGGAIAGPPGMIAGGVIGIAVGTLAGVVLEKDEHEAEVRDEELDATIGVRGGEMGAHDGLLAHRRDQDAERERRDAEELALAAELDAGPLSVPPTSRH